MKRSDKKG